MRPVDITGQEWSGCVALRRGNKNKYGVFSWWFRCTCRREFNATVSNVKSGRTKSCGCYGQPLRQTVKATTPIEWSVYRAWLHMKDRCYNPNNKMFHRYGSRGIVVCREWKDNFTQFKTDLGPKENIELTLERINNDGNYEPGNCKWATRKEQANNRTYA